jgi:hypothetical protein
MSKLLLDVPESQCEEVIDFLFYLKHKNDKTTIADLEAASASSLGFWDNSDDEVWDHV